MEKPQPPDSSGYVYACLAFGWWACVFPVLLIAANTRAEATAGATQAARWAWSFEFMAHRAVWALCVCLLLLACWKKGDELRALVKSPRTMGWLAVSALLIFGNWFGFVVGAATGRLSHASLGYYINPLVSVALGVVVLKEQMRPMQRVAVGLAAAGVAWETWRLGAAPWISLMVAFSFGLYGLVRKKLPVSAVTGLAGETAVMLPVALGYALYRETSGPPLVFGRDTAATALLLLSGVATAAPLIWFAKGVQSLPLSTVALLQFIVPTGQLLLAVTLNGESLNPKSLVTFAFIWAGVTVFLLDLRTRRRVEATACGDFEAA